MEGPAALAICRAYVACIPAALTCQTHNISRKTYRRILSDFATEIARLHRLADTLALTAPLALGITPHSQAHTHTPPAPTYIPASKLYSAARARATEAQHAEEYLARAVVRLGGAMGVAEAEGGGLGGEGERSGGGGHPSQNLPQFFGDPSPAAPPVSAASHTPTLATRLALLAPTPLECLSPAGYAEMFG